MTLGLLLTSFGLGLRHGIDWDHVAAIADLSGSAEDRRRGLWLSFLYAVGHAVVVMALGTAAIIFGAAIPDGLDVWMGRIVGLTLIWLGVWVLVQLIRQGRDFRLKSRWMLVLGGTFAGMRRVRSSRGQRQISLDHDHDHVHESLAHEHHAAHDHAHDRAHEPAHEHADTEHADTEHANTAGLFPAARLATGGSTRRTSTLRRFGGHRHQHRHDLALPDSASPYGSGTATGIGMLHGVGIESPTQIAVFVASTSVAGATAGVGLLVAWVVGLIVANSILAVLASAGLLQAERNFTLYATLAVVVAVLSIVMGVMFVGGIELAGPLAVALTLF